MRFAEQESPVHRRRVIAEPALEGQAARDVLYQALIVRLQLATEMYGRRQVVGIICRRKTEGVGENQRQIVQSHRVAEFDLECEEVVEMLGRLDQREPVRGSHALMQDIGDFERK